MTKITKMECAILVMVLLLAVVLGFSIAQGICKNTNRADVSTVTKLSGYGTRNLKYGHVNHQSDYDRERASQFLRKLNTESVYVKQGDPEYELVELFYRRVD